MADKIKFKPRGGRDYSKQFAKAYITADDEGRVNERFPRDRLLAQQTLDGAGGDLFFSTSYIGQRRVWNGLGRSLKRGAFVHIFGLRAEDCTVPDCPYKQQPCHGCQWGAKYFAHCRHSHDVAGTLSCSDCISGGHVKDCSIREIYQFYMSFSTLISAEHVTPDDVPAETTPPSIPGKSACEDAASSLRAPSEPASVDERLQALRTTTPSLDHSDETSMSVHDPDLAFRNFRRLLIDMPDTTLQARWDRLAAYRDAMAAEMRLRGLLVPGEVSPATSVKVLDHSAEVDLITF